MNITSGNFDLQARDRQDGEDGDGGLDRPGGELGGAVPGLSFGVGCDFSDLLLFGREYFFDAMEEAEERDDSQHRRDHPHFCIGCDRECAQNESVRVVRYGLLEQGEI